MFVSFNISLWKKVKLVCLIFNFFCQFFINLVINHHILRLINILL
jgi:hypothetical protein